MNLDTQFQLELTKRNSLKIKGIKKVISITPKECILDTIEGKLVLIGDNIEISHYNQENGDLRIQGCIDSMKFQTGLTKSKNTKGFFESILK